jgi:hypothetical protein
MGYQKEEAPQSFQPKAEFRAFGFPTLLTASEKHRSKSKDELDASIASKCILATVAHEDEMSKRCEEFLAQLERSRVANQEHQAQLEKYDEQLNSIERRMSGLECEKPHRITRKTQRKISNVSTSSAVSSASSMSGLECDKAPRTTRKIAPRKNSVASTSSAFSASPPRCTPHRTQELSKGKAYPTCACTA